MTRKNIFYTALAALAVFALMTSPLEANVLTHTAQAAVSENIPGPNFPPTPELQQSQKDAYMAIAMTVPGIKAWSDKWQFVTQDYVGTTVPTSQWTNMILHLHLPANVAAQKTCVNVWDALVNIDLSTNKIVASDFPSINSVCNTGLAHSIDPESNLQAEGMNLLPSAEAIGAKHSYSAAAQTDILGSGNSIQGSIVNLLTPSFSGQWSHLDGFVEQSVNERFSSTPGVNYLQTGWYIIGPAGCLASCNDSPQVDSKNIVYADSSTYGNSFPHIFGYHGSVPAWVNGQTLTAEVLCSGSANYKEQESYGTSLLSHLSSVPCSSVAQGNEIVNSAYFENANTAASSTWSSDITSTVQATGASEKLNGVWTGWQSANDEDQDCNKNITVTNAVISGYLNGATSTWSHLINQPVACN